MAKQGYVKIYRQISETAIWTDSDKIKLWLICLMKASHKECKQIVGNQVIELEKGQFITGRNALADEFNAGVSKKKRVDALTLFRWLNLFEESKMLNIKKTNKYSIITILNWNKYQDNEHQVNIKRTSNEHQMNTNKNVKNVKNDKNNTLKDIVEYLNLKAGKNFKATSKQTIEHINARINEGFTIDDFKKVIDTKTKQWKGNEKMNGFLRPQTLFSPSKFESYLNEGDTNETSERFVINGITQV